MRLPLQQYRHVMKFLRFQKTIALQRYVMFLRDSLTRLPKERLYYSKNRRRLRGGFDMGGISPVAQFASIRVAMPRCKWWSELAQSVGHPVPKVQELHI